MCFCYRLVSVLHLLLQPSSTNFGGPGVHEILDHILLRHHLGQLKVFPTIQIKNVVMVVSEQNTMCVPLHPRIQQNGLLYRIRTRP